MLMGIMRRADQGGSGVGGVADVAVELVAEVTEEVDLDVGPRGEVAVAPFGCDRLVLLAVEEEDRLAQAGPGGDDRDVPSFPPRSPRVEDVLFFEGQVQGPVS